MEISSIWEHAVSKSMRATVHPCVHAWALEILHALQTRENPIFFPFSKVSVPHSIPEDGANVHKLSIYQPPETNEAFSSLQLYIHTGVPQTSRSRILKCYKVIGVCGGDGACFAAGSGPDRNDQTIERRPE